MKNTLRKIVALFAVIAVFALAACGNTKEDDKQKDASKEKETTYSVEHAMGTTEIKGTPKRIVVLTNEGTEALLALGIQPVGAVQSWVGNLV